MSETIITAEKEQDFHRIVEASEKLYPLLFDEEKREFSNAIDLLKHKIIPLLRHECPLLVAVTGGGSVGKSTLFNFLAGGKYSGVKSKAGYTRRTLAAVHPSVTKDRSRMELLFDLFKKNALPVELKTPDEMLESGAPLYVESPRIPEQMAVLDTPDFDTGSKEEFANRDAAEEILVASDVLVYLFNNTTYNNKANTDFVRKAISGVGRRKVILVYRCSAAYPDEEVLEHFDTVLRNLFPDSGDPRREVLGIHRMDESDAVIRGEAEPMVRPLCGGTSLFELITGLDVVEARRDSLRSQVEAIVAKIRSVVELANVRRWELVAYRDSVKALAVQTALDGLKNFPQGQLMEAFAEQWRKSQPTLVRAAHWPGRKLMECYGWFCQKVKRETDEVKPSSAEEYKERFLADLRDGVGKLCAELCLPILTVEVSTAKAGTEELCEALKKLEERHVADYCISGSGVNAVCSVPRPFCLKSVLDETAKTVAASSKDEWTGRAAKDVCNNDDMGEDIAALVAEARKGMNFIERSKEGLWAGVAALPPVAAVAWTLCTSDPVVGAGAMAHLSAMFGMGDLWAAIAIPASMGLDAKHKEFLEARLKDLYAKWFERKSKPVLALIEENITDRCIGDCVRLLGTTEAPLSRLRESVENICKGEGRVA